MHGAVGVSEQTSIYAPGRGGRFAGVTAAAAALLIVLLICLPARAQMAPPAGPQNMQGAMPGRVTNPMMMPNTNPNMMPNTGGGMNGGMGGNTGGRMSNPAAGMQMPDDYYMRPMRGPGQPAAPSTSRRTTPSFVGMTRSQASALAGQYGLVPAFDGADSDDALVASQAPEAGTLIFRTAMPVRFQMQARAPLPPPQTAAPAEPVQPTPVQPTPAQPQTAQPTPTAGAPTSPPSAPTAAPARPAPARALTPPPAPPGSRNWWILLAIAAGLAGAMWALLGRRKTPKPTGFNDPQTGATARLTTRIVSTGLAQAAVSVEAAPAPRFELRYVVERAGQADGISISVGGGMDDG
jgi:hypothetical protein